MQKIYLPATVFYSITGCVTHLYVLVIVGQNKNKKNKGYRFI